MAVGLFNRTGDDAAMFLQWTDIKLTGKPRVRDLWRQRDIGILEGGFETNVPTHGFVIVRLIPIL